MKISEKFSEMETFLTQFHARYPGCTSRTMAQAANSNGSSSYDLLAHLVPSRGDGIAVLDLACGDGYLLSLLRSRNSKLNLFGVDMSEAELSAAKERVDPETALHLGKVQELQYGNRSMDFVVCHMALMLMDSLDVVLDEVRRVLKPGGVFSAVISGGRTKLDPVTENAFRALRAGVPQDRQNYFAKMGDPRLKSADGIRATFNDDVWASVSINNYEMIESHSIDGAVENYMSYYQSGLMTDAEQIETRKKIAASLANFADPAGAVICTDGVVHIVATSQE